MDATQPTMPAGPATSGSRRRATVATIAELLANRIAAAIVNGEYRDGERLRELDLAATHGVSRGPVREALRALERYGLAVLHPRRGAYVVGLSLEVIAEAFNARAALAGIAARQLARRDAARRAADEMEAALARARALADVPVEETYSFQIAIRETARCIYRHCGAGHIERALTDQVDRSIWGLMWKAQPMDFQRRERRLESLDYWTRILDALRRGDEHDAERLVRAEILTTRDSAIAALATARGETVDRALLFKG